MSLLWLGNNALFLKNFRERTRPSSIAAAAIATVLTVVVCVLSCYTISLGDRDFPWEAWSFYALAVIQALILLVLGSASLSNSAARERLVNTLDFHRVSPTSPLNMYIGMLSGGPVHEWCVYLAILPVGASLGLRGGVSPYDMTYLHSAIVLNAILFHSMAMLFTLGVEQKTLNRMLSVSGFGVCLVLAYVSFAAAGSAPAQPLYHMTCLPAFNDVAVALGGGGVSGVEAKGGFFNLRAPHWSMQLIVQVPLLLLASFASIRRLAHAERPLFSKPLALAACAYVFFVYLGAADQRDWAVASEDFGDLYRAVVFPFYYGLVFAVGCVGACMVTPTFLLHVRALRRMRKRGHHLLSPFEEGASSLSWLVSYTALAAGSMVFLLWTWQVSRWLQAVAMLALTLSYVTWFAGGYELAMLAGKGKRKALMAVAFAVPWVFMPIMGSLFAAGEMRLDIEHVVMTAFCPFVGISMFSSVDVASPEQAGYLWLVLVMNGILAFVVLSIAWSTRMRIYREQA